MSFKTLLAVITDQAQLSDTLAQAVAMASALDAHLDVVCIGVDRTQTGYYYAGMNAAVLQETMNHARENASEMSEAAKKALNVSGLRWGVTEGCASLPMCHGSWRRMRGLRIWPLCPAPMARTAGSNLSPS